MACIDREALIKKIFPYDVVDKKCYSINAKAIYEEVKNAPTCDVVPRSEVEAMQKRIANQREEIERLRKHTRNLQQSRNHYKAKTESVGKQLHNVLQGYQDKIDQAKQEAAREIFEEIERFLFKCKTPINFTEFAELKKEYIGE